MWIVMTAAACMPASCKGRYRRVALVKLAQEYTAKDMHPKMISNRARGVVNIEDMGRHNVGKTSRSAYYRVYAEAQRRAEALNNADPRAEGELLMSWGGSA